MKSNVSEKIANGILKAQRGFADFFGKKTAALGNRGKIVFLTGICIVFGGLSLISIVRVFTPVGNTTLAKPDQVALPKHFDKTGVISDNEVVIVSPGLYKRLKDFRIYMDSLRVNSILTYDSIVQARPGLMDSVLFLEQIYSEQKR